MRSIQKILLEVQCSEAFEHLEPLKDPKVWAKMKTTEKNLFAELLLLQGKQQLEEGDNEVIESFAMAAKVIPEDAVLLYKQGLIFASRKENTRCLHLAKNSFLECLKLDPFFPDAIFLLGVIYLEIGRFEADIDLISQAVKQFEHLEMLFHKSHDYKEEDLHWKWGLALSTMGILSGEPSDLCEALKYYSEAQKQGAATSFFFNDYGNTIADLATLLNQQARFLDAMELFQRATKAAPNEFEGWFNLGCCLLKLAEYSNEPEYLNQAHEIFSVASELTSSDFHLWVKWGQLTAMRGKYLNDNALIEASLEKFAKADDLEPNHPQILNQWAETELYLGVTLERVEYLNQAKDKIARSAEINPEDPETWYLYGSCLVEIGKYFDLEDYYFQAIEHFQYGLNLSQNEPILWYGLSLANFALGEISEEQHYYEKSASYCSKVIETGGDGFPQFWNDWGVTLMKLAEVSENSLYAEHALQKFEHAFKSLEESETQEPVDLDWIYNYACCFNILGNLTSEPLYLEKAILLLSRVTQQDPEFEDAKYTLGIALANFGDILHEYEPYEKAIIYLKALLNERPDHDKLHLDYGVTLVNLSLLVQDLHQPERFQSLIREAEFHIVRSANLGFHQAYYQLAGLYSIVELYPQAMRALEKARYLDAIPSIEEILQDEWLDGLRQTAEFRQFIHVLTTSQSDDDHS